jgi:hypothetical protein
MRIHVVLNLQRSSADCFTNNIQILQSITRRGQARCAVLNALPESALKAAWSSQLREAWPVLTGPSEYGVLSDHKINRIDELLPWRFVQSE